jgi:hypothetical protein
MYGNVRIRTDIYGNVRKIFPWRVKNMRLDVPESEEYEAGRARKWRIWGWTCPKVKNMRLDVPESWEFPAWTSNGVILKGGLYFSTKLDVLIGRSPAKKPPPFICSRILWFIFLAFILVFLVWKSSWPFDVISSINVDRPIKIYHMAATCPLLKVSKMVRTNGRLTRGSGCHMDQSGDDTCQFVPRGMPRRLQNGVDQWAIDTCHMCHVAVRPTPVGPSLGVVGTHPPTHHPSPTRVFLGSSPGVRKLHGCSGKFPRRSVKFRVFWGSSGCFWKVPGVFGKFPGCFGKNISIRY